MKKDKEAPKASKKKCKTDDPKEDLHHHSFRRLLCIDFDGVLHQYSQGWKGPDTIYDPPVPGAIAWLEDLIADPLFEPQVYSSRSKHPDGRQAMRAWLLEHGLSQAQLSQVEFPVEKPAAWLTIDDRCFLFRGRWPSKEYMLNFMGWTKRPELVRQANGDEPTDADFLVELARTHFSDRLDVARRLCRIADDLLGQRRVPP